MFYSLSESCFIMPKKKINVDLQKHYNIIRSKINTPTSDNAQQLIEFVTTNYTTNKKEVTAFCHQVNQYASNTNSKNSLDAQNFISLGTIKLEESNQVTNNQGDVFYLDITNNNVNQMILSKM